MNIEELQSMIDFAQCGSIRKAALKRGVHRSTMSRCLNKIEKEMQTQLFVETAAGIKATEAGQRYLKTAREIIEIYDQLNYSLHCDHKTALKPFTIAVSSPAYFDLLKPILKALKQRISSMTFDIQWGMPLEPCSLLKTGAVDAMLTTNSSDFDGLTFIPFIQDELGYYQGSYDGTKVLYTPIAFQETLSLLEPLIPFKAESIVLQSNEETALMNAQLNRGAALVYKSSLARLDHSFFIALPADQLTRRNWGLLLHAKCPYMPSLRLFKDEELISWS